LYKSFASATSAPIARIAASTATIPAFCLHGRIVPASLG